MAQNYDVFLSYRHKPLDGEITQKTFNFLERYRLPKALREEGCKSIERVFRDTEELAVSRILTHTIDEALRSADYLVIICSHFTPESEWVDREVMTFTEMGKADHIYPLLVEGSPEQSFTRTLKTIPDIMDRVMDVRCEGNDPKEVMKKAEKQLLRVVAAVAGCSAEHLRKADSMRSSRQLLTRGITTAAVLGAVALGSLGLWNRAEAFRQEATQAQTASMTILQELTYSLPNRLENLPGTYSRLAEILQTNALQINDILRLSTNAEEVRYEVGANYDKLATAYQTLGQTEAAETAVRQALAEYEGGDTESSLCREHMAEAYNDLGRICSSAGRYTEAAEAFEQAIRLQETLPEGTAALAQYTANAGINRLAIGDTQAGTELLEQALTMVPEEAWTDVRSLAWNYLQLGSGLRQLLEYDRAEEAAGKSVALFEQLYESGDYTRNVLDRLVQAKMLLAWCMADTGRYGEAAELYEQLLEPMEILASDEENLTYQQTKAQLHSNYAYVLNLQEDWTGAYAQYMKMALSYKKISEKTQNASDRAFYALATINAADNAFSAGDYSLAEQSFERGLSAYAEVCEELGSYHTANYLAYRAFTELVFDRDVFTAEADAWQALQLYGSVLTYCYSGTMCMYAGNIELADEIFTVLIDAGGGEPLRQVFSVLSEYGMEHEHMAAVLEMLGNA